MTTEDRQEADESNAVQCRLVVVPLTFKDACDFVTRLHRHHRAYRYGRTG